MRAKITFADTLDMGVLGGSSHRRERGTRNETRRDADRKLAAATVPRLVREGLAMRKAFLSAGVVAITWSMFHGAFALAITEGQELREALRFASAAAALKCTRFGGAFAAPQRAEVTALLGQGQAARPA